MENLIKWVEFENTGKGRKIILSDFEISVYQKRSEKTNQVTSYITFSTFLGNFYRDYTRLNVGFIGEKIVINFNNEKGLNLVLNKSVGKKNERLRVSNKEFTEMIFKCYGKSDLQSSIFELTDLGENTFLINKKK